MYSFCIETQEYVGNTTFDVNELIHAPALALAR